MHVADCESGQHGKPDTARQFDSQGNVLTNATHDYGYFQINKVHIKEAANMGYDLMTKEGNIAFAIYLYNKEGLTPWNPSKSCWSKYLTESDV